MRVGQAPVEFVAGGVFLGGRSASRRVALLLVLSLAGLLWACTEVDPRPASQRVPPDSALPAGPTGPSLASLLDPRVSPYLHNPVSWRLENARLGDAPDRGRLGLTMTTTQERVVLDGVGLLFKLVVALQYPGSDGQPSPALEDGEYRSHVALLTPEGLYLSEPAAFDGDLRSRAADVAAELMREAPTWPLPGAFGCRARVRSVRLPFGAVQGLETHCPSYDTPLGRARVTTLWLDRVGFAYREVRPLDGEQAGSIHYDVLTGGDLVELAPPADEPDSERVGPGP